ncbi:hypothetical protein BOO92_21120 [Vibrio navarrensis]|uniref:hypothetical protein n=1 Tax=Vibrio navarrensis TaxID=29495 RepID=UPI0018677067|nr:hypothetical protein [Vibrio navarrensis]MBE3659159.1 hypothetical protein [Vibrio navarrensis]
MRLTAITSTILFTLTGCVNQFASMPDVSSVTDPIEYVEQYSSASEKGLINPLAFVGGRDDGNNYRKYRRSWCAVHDNGPDKLKAELSKVCENKGGELRNEWCVDTSTETPLFKADIANSTLKCSTGISTYAEVITPLSESAVTDSKWNSLAKSNGFKTASELELEEGFRQAKMKAEKLAMEQKALQEKQRRILERDRMLSTRGLRICQKGDLGTYVGFVEDFTEFKVKIHVVNYGGKSFTVSGFRESTIWDYPGNWYICE